MRGMNVWMPLVVVGLLAAPALGALDMPYLIIEPDVHLADVIEDFDGMGPTGTAAPGFPVPFLPWESYWSVDNAGAQEYDNLRVAASASSAAGGYNMGLVGDSDRALGMVQAGAQDNRTMAALFENATGALWSSVCIEFDAEPWICVTPTAQGAGLGVVLDVKGTLIDTGLEAHWTQAQMEGWAKDGNLIDGNTYKVHLAGLIPLPLDVRLWDGDQFEVRFSYVGYGAYSGVGVDNLKVAFIPEPATLALLGLGLGAVLIRRRK